MNPVFCVLNMKRCISDETLIIPLREIRVSENLMFVKEPVKVLDREVEHTKQSPIMIVKVPWNAKRGPKFTWETCRSDEVPILSFANLSLERISGRSSL